jgi:hypothetical protein
LADGRGFQRPSGRFEKTFGHGPRAARSMFDRGRAGGVPSNAERLPTAPFSRDSLRCFRERQGRARNAAQGARQSVRGLRTFDGAVRTRVGQVRRGTSGGPERWGGRLRACGSFGGRLFRPRRFVARFAGSRSPPRSDEPRRRSGSSSAGASLPSARCGRDSLRAVQARAGSRCAVRAAFAQREVEARRVVLRHVAHCAPHRASPCLAVPRCASPCLAVPRCASLCLALPRFASLCLAAPRRVSSCLVVPRRASSCFAMPRSAVLAVSNCL